MAGSDNESADATLALSDIVHTVSPSPAPLNHDESTLKPEVERATSPEPITEELVSSFRKRLVEMGLSTDGMKKSVGVNISSREEELLDMVLALTRSPLISPAQLAAQAETIANLQFQRERIALELETEQSRWEVERYGWERMAEALIAQRNRTGFGGSASEELLRKCSSFECDNRILRDRLQDSHNRNLALEAEINKLKPLLLMLPLITNSNGKGKKRKQSSEERERTPTVSGVAQPSLPRTVFTETTASNTRVNPPSSNAASSSTAVAGPEFYRYPYPYSYLTLAPKPGQASTSSPQPSRGVNPYLSYVSPRVTTHQNASSTSAQQYPSSIPLASISRPTKSGKEKRRSSPSQTLSSDARTEHLLLAARKIGRERASALAGLTQQAEKEKENYSKERDAHRAAKESERLERERLERLRSGASGGQYYRNVAPAVGGSGPARGQLPSTPKRMEPPLPSTSTTGINQVTGPPTTFVYVQTPGHSNAAAIATASRSRAPSIDPSRLPPSAADHTPHPPHAAFDPRKSAELPQTPHRQQLAGQAQQGSNVQTPLDSLLRAARNMMSDGSPPEAGGHDHDRNTAGGRRRGASEMEAPESPMPAKRRKTAAGGSGTNGTSVFRHVAGTRRSAPKLTQESRVPSALDVLADQAQVAAALSDGRAPLAQTSNARAEGGRDVGGAELDVWRVGAGETSTSGRRRSTRGRGTGAARGKGRGRGRGGKGKGKELDRTEEDATLAKRQDGPTSDGESEIDLAVRGDEERNPEATSTADHIPAKSPEPRKRGRPRKSDQVPTTQSASPESKGQAGTSLSPSQRSRVPSAISMVPSAASDSVVVRRRGAVPVSRAREPASTAKKSGRGGPRGKVNTAATSTALNVPQQEFVVLAAPRIIAPPRIVEHPGNGNITSKPTLSPLDEALAQYEQEKLQIARQRSQPASSSWRAGDHAGSQKSSTTPRLADKSVPADKDSLAVNVLAVSALPGSLADAADEDIAMGGSESSLPTADSLDQGRAKDSSAKPEFRGNASKSDPEHDSELDAEAEAYSDNGLDADADGDEDIDAEGEDEDEREADEATTHVAFSSSDISKLIQGAEIVTGEDDGDADAEGEVEEETDQADVPPAFPSRTV